MKEFIAMDQIKNKKAWLVYITDMKSLELFHGRKLVEKEIVYRKVMFQE